MAGSETIRDHGAEVKRTYNKIGPVRRRYLLKAAMLRNRLTDKALAHRFGVCTDTIQNAIKRARQEMRA